MKFAQNVDRNDRISNEGGAMRSWPVLIVMLFVSSYAFGFNGDCNMTNSCPGAPNTSSYGQSISGSNTGSTLLSGLIEAVGALKPGALGDPTNDPARIGLNGTEATVLPGGSPVDSLTGKKVPSQYNDPNTPGNGVAY